MSLELQDFLQSHGCKLISTEKGLTEQAVDNDDVRSHPIFTIETPTKHRKELIEIIEKLTKKNNEHLFLPFYF